MKGKCKNLTNRNQDHSPSSEPSTPTLPSPGQANTPEKLDPDLKAYLMMMVEDITKDYNNSLKKYRETTGHLPGESTGVCPAREVCASGPGGSLFGSGTPRRAGCTGDSVEYRGQPFLGQARATELLRRRHLRLQTTGHLPGESHRASEVAPSSAPDNRPPSWPKQHSFWERSCFGPSSSARRRSKHQITVHLP